MPQSMTGFGGAEGPVGTERIRIEIRTVNHRHLQVQWKLPTELQSHQSTEAPHISPSREEVTRNCLEAHRKLMEISPANIPKFKEVAQFLAEDLKKLKSEK